MANDRIYLICKKCKLKKLLYKYYPGCGYANDVNDFMQYHINECQQHYESTLNNDPKFMLETE